MPENLQSFVNVLADEIEERMEGLGNNRILQLATLLDPRFTYDEEFWSRARWGLFEEELVAFARESGRFHIRVIITNLIISDLESIVIDEEQEGPSSSTHIADSSLDDELALDGSEEKSDGSLECTMIFIRSH